MTKYLACLLLFFYGTAYSQSRPTPKVIKHLLEFPGEIPVINGWFRGLIPDEMMPAQLRKEMQYLLKTKESLYVGINGTGRLYRITDLNGNLSFQRIDTTFFEGYNFFSASFSLRDTIYSYGGYGFWRTNGHLRTYNKLYREWDIQLANQSPNGLFNFTSSFWIDTLHRNFYLQDPCTIDEGISITLSKPDTKVKVGIYQLNLDKQEWVKLGITDRIIDIGFIQSPWGCLYMGGANLHILNDFVNNKSYQSGKQLSLRLKLPHLYEENGGVRFFIDSTLFVGDFRHNSLDSVTISLNDFVPVGVVYQKEGTLSESSITGPWLWVIGLMIAFVMGAWYFQRRKIRAGKASEIPGSLASIHELAKEDSPANKRELFTSVEKELLQLILEKSRKQKMATMDEVNRVIGLANKPESIQKKNRFEAIQSINKKWTAYSGENELLIFRKRSEVDKRIMEYGIDVQKVGIMQEII